VWVAWAIHTCAPNGTQQHCQAQNRPAHRRPLTTFVHAFLLAVAPLSPLPLRDHEGSPWFPAGPCKTMPPSGHLRSLPFPIEKNRRWRESCISPKNVGQIHACDALQTTAIGRASRRASLCVSHSLRRWTRAIAASSARLVVGFVSANIGCHNRQRGRSITWQYGNDHISGSAC
jgi:hypothetical protein